MVDLVEVDGVGGRICLLEGISGWVWSEKGHVLDIALEEGFMWGCLTCSESFCVRLVFLILY